MITELNARSDTAAATAEKSSAKVLFVAALFVVSLASFIAQTEFTSQAYLHGFSEPAVLLLVTHGSWWLLWPMQAVLVSLARTAAKAAEKPSGYERLESGLMEPESPGPVPAGREPAREPREPSRGPKSRPRLFRYFKKCLVKQIHNVYHTSVLVYEANANGDTSTRNLQALLDQNPHVSASASVGACVASFVRTPAFRYMATKTALISVVLNVAGGTWYGAMAMTYASDVTAIYNCSAFTAYAFAIPLLHERFSWAKASSVAIAVAGVFIVAYSGADSAAAHDQYPHRFWGNVIISVGAVLYGYYEVLYKKYTCVPDHLAKVITPRRQSTLANFVMGLMGVFTLAFLLTGVVLAQLLGIHHFNLFDYGADTARIWLFIAGSIVSNLLFSAAFLSLMALTSPVLSSVSSLVTIFLIGIVEWVLFGNRLGFSQLMGDSLVIVGFAILTAASWKEISEGRDDDEIEAASLYSFAPSENTLNMQ